jgi:hypothetical protein
VRSYVLGALLGVAACGKDAPPRHDPPAEPSQEDTAESCRASAACATEGRCGVEAGACVLDEDGCKKQPRCKARGECTLVLWSPPNSYVTTKERYCVVGSADDCAQSDACKVDGACTIEGVMGSGRSPRRLVCSK